MIIRQWKKEDASNLAKILSDKKILNNLRDGLPYPYTEKDGEEFISAMLAADKKDVFSFAVVEDGKAVGTVGIFRQGNIHRLTGELGFYLAADHWGKGIMTEAVKEVCRYVFNNSDIIRIYADVFSDNIGSVRVLEKNGFTCEGVLRKSAVKNGIIKDVKLYALLK